MLTLFTSPSIATLNPPKLIVQIVVDQLRGDLLYRYQDKFSTKGFNYLRLHGINFQNTHYQHANTVTCVGHASIATGSYPNLHGIIANEWFDTVTNQTQYCVEDLTSTILPTPHTKKILAGRSAKNLVASTFSDELILAKKGVAFTVSLKDRGAITLAGHAGKAFWFDKDNGGFVTSDYYFKQYPGWVSRWNQHYQPKNQTWQLMHPKKNYQWGKLNHFEHRFPEFGQNFPHQLGEVNNDNYFKFLSMTPFADELTADFAINLLINEQLGKHPAQTDYLGISFSAVDGIGHQFSPNSLESEDNLLRLDKILAKLLKAIDQQVGLGKTLIVLTADHGVSDSPTYLKHHHFVQPLAIEVDRLKQQLVDALMVYYQLPAATIKAIALPYIYLDHALIHEKKKTVATVSQFLVEILNQKPDVFQAYTLPVLFQQDWLSAKVAKMAFTKRSGDIYLVQMPFQINITNASRVNHDSGWQYDSFVPLLFVNPNFKALVLDTVASPTDIAATLAMILKISVPSASVGNALTAVTQHYH